jgi:3'-phosphoadenosine 5'-phosphosulfate sulfotransferase (PAPS reductase)/FAD synthetase
MYIIPANFGNDSLALIQWAYEAKVTPVTVTYVDTGWAAPEWPARVERCKVWVESLGFHFVLLKPKVDFPTLMREQKGFPTRKFQWCASFLKGLPLLAWLDQPANDPGCVATIMLAHRRSASRAKATLAEFIDESEHYGERNLWHPLYLHTLEERDALLQRAGFEVLSHRSLECDPCVNSDAVDVLRMDLSVIERTATLEKELHQKMLDPDLLAQPIAMTNRAELFDMGCGSPYGCGL